jgi:hypothetical protein
VTFESRDCAEEGIDFLSTNGTFIPGKSRDDKTGCQIYIGNVPIEKSDDELKEYLLKHIGKVIEFSRHEHLVAIYVEIDDSTRERLPDYFSPLPMTYPTKKSTTRSVASTAGGSKKSTMSTGSRCKEGCKEGVMWKDVVGASSSSP